MKIYTRSGDDGGTGLFGGARVLKDDARVRAYGALDEANAAIGVSAACAETPADVRAHLHRVMSDLFDIGAELATPALDEATIRQKLSSLVEEPRVTALEQAIDAAETELSPLSTFILPTGTEAAARLHLARTVVRRAEREVVSLSQSVFVRGIVVKYINRLSDALFVWARLANARQGVVDTPWQKHG